MIARTPTSAESTRGPTSTPLRVGRKVTSNASCPKSLSPIFSPFHQKRPPPDQNIDHLLSPSPRFPRSPRLLPGNFSELLHLEVPSLVALSPVPGLNSCCPVHLVLFHNPIIQNPLIEPELGFPLSLLDPLHLDSSCFDPAAANLHHGPDHPLIECRHRSSKVTKGHHSLSCSILDTCRIELYLPSIPQSR